jgi:mannose-1-phosphate guanylyltransferase
MTYAVIMAGGVGSRFWPRSRKQKPKQMLNIFGDNTLLQETVARISQLIPGDNVHVVTTQELSPTIQQQLPDLKDANFIIEPVGRNTAPCIGLAAVKLAQTDLDGLMIVLPADHLISDSDRFLNCLRQALQTAEQHDALVTIGITPTHPETGYGYIQYNPNKPKSTGAYDVITFAEKPNLETAKRFLASGDFFWNSGMFIWSVRRILKEMETSLPELYSALIEIQELLNSGQAEQAYSLYASIRPISVDFGIMEKARQVAVVRGDFKWTDVGNWSEVYRLSAKDKNGNVNLNGNVLIAAKNCYIDSPDRFVALVGVQDLIVINTSDALLICHRDQAQDVKLAVEYMERHNFDKYL